MSSLLSRPSIGASELKRLMLQGDDVVDRHDDGAYAFETDSEQSLISISS